MSDAPPRRRRPARTLVAGALGLALLVLLRTEVAGPQRITGHSMSPTLRGGDVVLVEQLSGRAGRGELVTFRSPADGAVTLKRVAGVAGDVVDISDGRLHVGGRAVSEPYVDAAAVDGLFYGPVTVPEGTVLVLGDNRGDSIDSRAYGPVPVRAVTGRVLLRVWPVRRAQAR